MHTDLCKVDVVSYRDKQPMKDKTWQGGKSRMLMLMRMSNSFLRKLQVTKGRL